MKTIKTKFNSLRRGTSTALLIMAMSVCSQIFAENVTGTLGVVWGDRQQSSEAGLIEYTLEKDNGDKIPLNLSKDTIAKAGGLHKIRGKRVHVDTSAATLGKSKSLKKNKRNVNSLIIANGFSDSGSSVTAQASGQQGLSGPQVYVSILCKFSDKPSEPQDWNFFNNMYGNSPGQLGHFWEETSSGKVNLTNSRAYGGTNGNNGWYNLPSPKSAYVNSTYPNGDLNKLFNDCVGVANSHIDFTSVKGINLMFNDSIGSYAWGGGLTTTLDGVTRYWPTTWEPTWGWANVSILAHEMGHSFGLPHSNNSDGDSNPYDSPWSLMSDAWGYGVQDPTYGIRGKHVNAYEKDQLNWFSGGETFTAPDGETHTLNIDSLSLDLAGTGAYRILKIPFLSGGKYYTVETRKTSGAYEANLPGTAVIIHEIDETRSEPSWVVDKNTPAGGSGDTEGVMWKVGEVFTDTTNNIKITVNSVTSGGFQVTINRGSVTVLTPSISFPAPNSTLPGATATFQLDNAGANVTTWGIWVGSTIGAFDLGSQATDGSNNSITFNTLPTDGSTVFISLYYTIDNSPWIKEGDYSYIAASSNNQPNISSPLSGTTLPGSTVTFQLDNTGSNVTTWGIWVGSTIGAFDLGSQATDGSNNSITFNTFPTDGSTIFISLYYTIDNGPWIKEGDYSYIAASSNNQPNISFPLSSTTLPGGGATFQLDNAGANVTTWGIWVGSTIGAFDLGSQATHGSNNSITFNTLPTDGSTVFISLYYTIDNGPWIKGGEYSYIAATSNNQPIISFPLSGTTLPGATATFQLDNAGANVTSWGMWVGSTIGAFDLGSQATHGSNNSITFNTLPTDGSTVFISLYYTINNGSWIKGSDYSYIAY